MELGEKAGIEVKIQEGAQDRKVTIKIKETYFHGMEVPMPIMAYHNVKKTTDFLRKIGVKYVFGYELNPESRVLYILPETVNKGPLAGGDESAPILTVRNGKIYSAENISRNIRVLKETTQNDLKAEKIEFLDDAGRIVQTRYVFPRNVTIKGMNKFILSPEGMYLVVLTAYSILDENVMGESEYRTSYYNSKGDLMWYEVPKVEDMESWLIAKKRYPRDNGTMLEILGGQAIMIQKNNKGEEVLNTHLETNWTGIPYWDQDSGISIRIKTVDSSPYLVMSRMPAGPLSEPEGYEIYFINADEGKVIWKQLIEEKGGNLEGVFHHQGVIIVREWIGDPVKRILSSFRAYDYMGNDVWSVNADSATGIRAEDSDTLRLIFTKRVVEKSIVRDVPIRWSLINCKTGETIKEGKYQ